MSIRTILTGEDEPVLHKVCHPVTSFDQKLADLLGHSSIETTRIYLISTGAEHARQLERMGLVQ